MTTGAHAQLVQLLDERASVRGGSHGEFKLASGEASSFYFDGKRVTQSCEGLPLVGQLVWEFAESIGATAVGGLAAGSISISDAAVAYAAFVSHTELRGFYVLADKKDHGTRENLFQAFHPKHERLLSKGTPVLIVDDVMTTGRSLQEAIDEVGKRGAVVKGVLVLVDRKDPEADTIRQGDHEFFAVAEADEDGKLTLPSTGRGAPVAL